MDVITYVGRTASVLKVDAVDNIEFNKSSTDLFNEIKKEKAKKMNNSFKNRAFSRKNESYNPYTEALNTNKNLKDRKQSIFGVNGYSPKKENISSFSTFNSASKSKSDNKISYKYSKPFFLTFLTLSLIITVTVFYFNFHFLNNKYDHFDLTKFIFYKEPFSLDNSFVNSSSKNNENPTVTKIEDENNLTTDDLESLDWKNVDLQSLDIDSLDFSNRYNELNKYDEDTLLNDDNSVQTVQNVVDVNKINTIDGLFGLKVAEAIERLAFFSQQNDAQFDTDGNLVINDSLDIDNFELGEPISYSKYTVRSGDTIESITYKFGLRSISTLIAANEIKNVRTLRAGQKLIIPSQDGLIHSIKSGESLISLSVKYHVSVEDLLDTNDLTSDILSIGQKIFIPGAKMDIDSLRNAMGETFTCPITAKWRLTSHFGPRTDPISGAYTSHTGIDMASPKGTPIKAAMSGTVIKAAWSNIYGHYVIIKHPNGYQSLYGHMTKYIVKLGQYVEQGTKIGYVGSTGYSTGPHLHFTVYKNGKRVDPLPLIKK